MVSLIASSVVASQKVDLIERQAAADEVRVRVVEAGHDRAALGVDDGGLRAAQALNLAVRADAHDLVAADGDGFGEIGAAVATRRPCR